MAKRRGPGEGSIYQRKSDGLWVGSLTVGWTYDAATQKSVRDRRSYYGKSRAEVAAKLAEESVKRNRGLIIDVDRQTVAEFLDHWLANEIKPNREPKTYESYESTVRRHISPEIGRIQLARLSPQHVQAMLRLKEQDPKLSARSVAYIRTVLRIALNRAVKWELVTRNVAAMVDPPKVHRQEVTPWTRDEAMRFLDAAQDDRLGALYSVALAVGLRKSEALGMRWEDVDLRTGRLEVRNQLQRIKGEGLVLKRLKTEKSRRVLVLPAPTIAALKQHHVRQLEERLIAGKRWVDSGYIFTTTVGTPIDPTNVNRFYNRLVKSAGLPHRRFHDQRHWCATLLLAQKIPARVVMELLGHTQLSTTMDLYSHVIDDDRREAAAAMERVFELDREAN